MSPKFVTVLALVMVGPALAGEVAKGEVDFKKCKSCHSVISPDGTEIQKGGQTGPNLWGIIGGSVASNPDFKYGGGILAAKAAGAVWDEAAIATYLADPSAWVKTASGDDTAKTKMSFKLAAGGEDLAAYLVTLK